MLRPIHQYLPCSASRSSWVGLWRGSCLFGNSQGGRSLTTTTTTVRVAKQAAVAGPYGLRMPDYSSPPPKWPLPAHPPLRNTPKILGPTLAGLFLVGLVYVYFNQDEDIYEYWKQVEQGNVPLDGFGGGDDDFDDDEDDFDDDDDDDDD